MLTQVSFLLSVSNNVPELRKSLETTKVTLSPSIVSTFTYSSFFVVVFFSLKLKFKNGKQNKNKKKKKKKKKTQTKIKRHTQKTERSETARLSGCNNIQGTESFEKDFLIHVICVCVEKR